MASIRRELRIHRPAEDVWPLISDPGRISEWFPGIVSAEVTQDDEGVARTVTLATGIPLVERVVTNDPISHRFQYRITGVNIVSMVCPSSMENTDSIAWPPYRPG